MVDWAEGGLRVKAQQFGSLLRKTAGICLFFRDNSASFALPHRSLRTQRHAEIMSSSLPLYAPKLLAPSSKMKINRRFYSAAIAGASLSALIASSQNASALVTTNVLSNTSYELAVYDDLGEIVTPDGRPRWTWGYNYSWGYADGQSPNINASQDTFWMDPPENPTNTVARTTFDTAPWADPPTGSGFGQGFGGSMNWNLYDPSTVWTTNRAHYILSFDAKVEGLLDGVNQLNMEMQTRFDSPDDTLQPADGNTDGDTLLQVNRTVPVGSNWTHYVYTLDEGNIGSGSEANIATYATVINGLSYGVNVHMPHEAFGYDSENFVYVDNIKLQMIVDTNPPAAQPPLEVLTISDWNFDDRDIWYSYSYPYTASGSQPGFFADYHAPEYGVGGSNAWILRLTNSIYNTESLPAWAGVGTGGGGPVDVSLLSTPDLSKYRITFSSRVHGLAPETTETTLRLQFFIRGPDDTLQPADANTGEDDLIRLDFNVPASTNWTTTSYLLSTGSVGGGSKANLTNYLSSVIDWRPQWQIENPTSQAVWGYDDDNMLVIDDVKLERLVPAAPRPTITRSANEIEIGWTAPQEGTVKLQSAPTASGPYTDVASPSNPYRTPTTGDQRFFRTIWAP